MKRPWETHTTSSVLSSVTSVSQSKDGQVESSPDGRKVAHGFMGMLEMMGASPDAVTFDGGDAGE